MGRKGKGRFRSSTSKRTQKSLSPNQRSLLPKRLRRRKLFQNLRRKRNLLRRRLYQSLRRNRKFRQRNRK